MSDPLIGRTLSKYLVQQEIGRGGMARVYRALDTVLQRPVALKVLAPALSADPDFSKRFEREAITAANLRHPAIVTIFDVGEADGLRYIAMEYIGGRTLDAVLHERGPLGVSLAIAILDPVAEALDFAHATGMVHRDIKPHNIMLDADGRVLLTDFGIAIDPSEADDRLTRTGTFMGTPEYLSPEQAQAQPLTGRSDLYSLGIVAYEMLSGRVPFAGGTPQQIMAHVYQAPPPITSIDPSAPPELDQILARILSKDPAARFERAGMLVSALRYVQQRYNLTPATRGDIAAIAVAADSSAGRATVAVAAGLASPAPAGTPAGGQLPGVQPAPAPGHASAAQTAAAGASQPPVATSPGGKRPPSGQYTRQPTGQGYSYAGGGDQFVPPPRIPRRRYYEDDGGGSVPWSLLAVGAVALVAIALLVALTGNIGGSTGGNPFVPTPTANVAVSVTATPSPSPEPSAAPSPEPSTAPTPSPSAAEFPTLVPVPATPDPAEVGTPTVEPTAEPTGPTVVPTPEPTATATPSPEASIAPTIAPSPSAEPATATAGPTALPSVAETPTATVGTPTPAVTETPVATATLAPTAEASAPPSPPSSPAASSPPTPELPPSTPLPPPTATQTSAGVPTPVGGGGRLAFFQGDTLLIRDIDNNAAEPVDIGGLEPGGPAAVSPDGATVLLDVRDPATNTRQILALNGDILRPLTQGPGENFNPSWRSDGAAIIFASTRNGDADLFVMAADGSNQRAVTSGPGDDLYPSWKANGTRIAFESTRDGPHQAIYTVDPQGGPVTRVSPAGGASYRSPRWSPSGSALAFVSDRERPDGGFEVYVQQVDTGETRRVTTFSNGSTGDPAWSPDGTILAFSSDSEGSQDIYVVDLVNDVLLPSPANAADVDERYPVWE